MPLYYGNTKIKDLYVGNTRIKEAYLNGVKVYRRSAYNPGQVIFEKNSPNTYNLALLEDGIYEITCVAGGASGVGRGDNSSRWQSAGGASGACYKGRFYLTKRNVSIVVGSGGSISTWSGFIKIGSQKVKRTGYTGSAGGISSVSGVVSCPSQSASGHNGIYLYSGNGGVPSLSITPVSTSINKAGNNSTAGYNFTSRTGAVSSYNNSSTGAGAGGNCSVSGSNMTATTGINGYVKIVYIE